MIQFTSDLNRTDYLSQNR